MPFLIALKLFAGNALGKLWTWLCHRSFWQLVSMALAGVCLLLWFQRNDARSDADRWHNQFKSEHSARIADRQAYERAQAKAKAKNLATIELTKKQQQEVSDARLADLNSRLQLLARELRNNPTAKGSAGRTPLPETGPTPCRAYDPAWLCLSPDDRLLAAQNEERHDQLISWLELITGIDPNKN